MKTNMKVQERSLFQKIELNFVFVILALNFIGLINLYSATHGLVQTVNERLFFQQVVWLFVGWMIFFATTVIDYDIWKRLGIVFYVLNIAALIAVMFVGRYVYGSQRWLDLGFFRYQPSETVKLAVVLVMAQYLSRKSAKKGLGLLDLIVPAILTGIPFVLTVKQPDLGTALLIAAITTSMIVFVRVKGYIIVIGVIIGLLATPIAWNFGLKDYQRNRVLTFLSPGRDPRGSGYNSIQSKIAVGSGRILGKGFQKGTQSQLEFIPERHSDFIFSVLSEEFGFIGSITTAALFLVLYIMGVNIASQAKDKFGVLVAVGVLSTLFWHMFINICMVIGLLPIVGVPLPLLSYGGSSMLTTMMGLGLVSSVGYRKYLF